MKNRSHNTSKKLIQALGSLPGALVSALLPRRCLRCKQIQQATHFCAACYAELPYQHHCCRHCGQILNAQADTCGRCLQNPPHYDACFCPFRYRDPIDALVRDFKYHDRPQLANAITDLLANELLAAEISMPDLLIPVPLHISKLRERGYNQAWEITRRLSSELGIPCSRQHLIKHRATASQAEQSMVQRRHNIRGSFRLLKAPGANHIALIDDVVTTGSTASEIAKILKRNGVDYVQVWGIAHTV